MYGTILFSIEINSTEYGGQRGTDMQLSCNNNFTAMPMIVKHGVIIPGGEPACIGWKR